MQDVLVAARDLKEEESLKPDMVKVVKMAKSAVPPNSFSSFKDVEDRWVNMSMLEGDVLIEKKLGPKGTPPGLVNNIPKGMRAMSIDVTEQTGVSGFILPGHRVDVIRFENSDQNEMHGETILQDVLVLAANQLFIRPEERAVQSRTVTLAVSPETWPYWSKPAPRGHFPWRSAVSMIMTSCASVRSKSSVEAELEKRLKEQEEKRLKLERDLKLVAGGAGTEGGATTFHRSLLHRRPPLLFLRRRGIVAIYRGIHNLQRIRTDFSSGDELESSSGELWLDPGSSQQSASARNQGSQASSRPLTRIE